LIRYQKTQGFNPTGVSFEPPPRWSIARSAIFASDGTLWILNSLGPDEGRMYTVFSRNGVLLYRIALPGSFALRAIAGNLLYGSVRTELDAPVVKVYRLPAGLAFVSCDRPPCYLRATR